MHRTRITTFFLASAVAAVTALAISPAHAVQRAHVSAAIGVDTNTATGCTPIAPCRTFQAAMTVTDTNGEVVVLDSGGYGAVTITQSVALIAPTGVYAGISVFPNANGVTIDAPGANVVLRGLSINGQDGLNGIIMTAGNKLTVENCVISNLNLTGIIVTGDTTVRVTDTIIRDNQFGGVLLQDGANGTINRVIISGLTGNSGAGVHVKGLVGGTTTTADISDATISGNRDGVVAISQDANALVKVSVRDSRIVQNLDNGLLAQSTAGAVVSLSASNNIVSNNGLGIFALRPGAKIWASGNTVTDNSNLGLLNSGGTFDSAGNNAVRNNKTDAQGTITTIATK